MTVMMGDLRGRDAWIAGPRGGQRRALKLNNGQGCGATNKSAARERCARAEPNAPEQLPWIIGRGSGFGLGASAPPTADPFPQCKLPALGSSPKAAGRGRRAMRARRVKIEPVSTVFHCLEAPFVEGTQLQRRRPSEKMSPCSSSSSSSSSSFSSSPSCEIPPTAIPGRRLRVAPLQQAPSEREPLLARDDEADFVPASNLVSKWETLLGLSDHDLFRWKREFEAKYSGPHANAAPRAAAAAAARPLHSCETIQEEVGGGWGESPLSTQRSLTRSAPESCAPRPRPPLLPRAASQGAPVGWGVGGRGFARLALFDRECLRSPPLVGGGGDADSDGGLSPPAGAGAGGWGEGGGSPQTAVGEGGEMLSLVYDQVLGCYYDHTSGKYYKLLVVGEAARELHK